MISVLILTKNEEEEIRGCLNSVAWSDDVHVLDSYSSDLTVEIAKANGANVVQREFDNWSAHQNWALSKIPFRNDWVFYLDADERVTPALATNIRKAISDADDKVAFRIRRRDFWGERWLKHVQASSYYLRLFRPQKMRYERLVNPVSVPLGPVGDVKGFIDHYPFSKGVAHWLSRHNSYSSLEAQQIIRNRQAKSDFSLSRALFGTDRNERRFHQKELFYRIPARPLFKFALLYLGKRGFLDGAAGFRYAALQSFYEYMIVLKTKELIESASATAESNRDGAIPTATLKEDYANSRTRD